MFATSISAQDPLLPVTDQLLCNGPAIKTRITSPVFTGRTQQVARRLIWLNIFLVACRLFKNPVTALVQTRSMLRFRNKFRNGHVLRKFAKTGNRFFFTYNAPGWPSLAFNRYIRHQLKNIKEGIQNNSIHTVLFGITKKCGFQCEHCCEWENLNKPEVLSREDLVQIVHRFQDIGVTQVQLSGGEPLNRFDDLLYLLDQAKKGTDIWVLTSGYSLTYERAQRLKQHGLTGITLSLDHCDEHLHDSFRGKPGSFKRVFRSAFFARQAGLAVCFSLCPTQSFINGENLLHYTRLAQEAGASFIQLLEPKAVGHYANQQVELTSAEINELEIFMKR